MKNPIVSNVKTRIAYSATFFLFLVIEVMIALYVHDSFIRPYAGDALVVIVVYCFVRIFITEKYRLLPLYVFLFAVIVECLQYFELVKKLGLEGNAFFRILLGSVFDVKDILCYAAGCILLGVFEFYKWKKSKKSNIIAGQ